MKKTLCIILMLGLTSCVMTEKERKVRRYSEEIERVFGRKADIIIFEGKEYKAD